MAGHFTVKMLKSQTVEESDVLASERWNVEKERRKQDNELADFYEKQMNKCKSIKNRSNSTGVDLYEKLLFKIRWALPPLPMRHRFLVVEYCEHLLGLQTGNSFKKQHVLDMCVEISKGTPGEKIALEIQDLYEKIRRLMEKRDSSIRSIQANLQATTEKAIVKNEGKLKWMAETNPGRKDRYWTVWFLASRGMIPELTRLLKSPKKHDVNERDPDHGLTALHYACKGRNLAVVQLLMDHGADILLTSFDGRTPLHYAAQYSSKEIVALLVENGAYYQALDNFGCAPIDLADQNKNKETFDYLDHWTKLLPPERVSTPEPEPDLSHIPDEYIATSKEVFDAMSLKLQMLTKRIDGESAHSFGVSRDPWVEMRLCEKHGILALKEGMAKECIKSLRRRWRIAKNLCMAVESSAAESGQPSHIEHDVSLAESKGLPHLASGSLVDVSRDSSSGSMPSVAIERSMSNITSFTEFSGMNSEEGSIADNHESVDATQSLRDSAPVASLPKPAPHGTKTMRPSSVVVIAQDLVELLVKQKYEGFALVILQECLQIPGVDSAHKLALLARACELVLFIHDRLDEQQGVESARTTPHPPSHQGAKSESSTAPGTGSNSMLHTARSRSPLSSYSPTRVPSPAMQGMMMMSSSATATLSEHLVLPSINSTAASRRGSSHQPTNRSNDSTHSSHTRRESLGPIDSTSAPSITRSINAINRPYRCRQLIEFGKNSVAEAVHIHREIHVDYVGGVEPCTLIPLLEMAGEMEERDDDLHAALQFMEHAETVSNRALGYSHEETIRIMLLGVKLHLKCANVEAYKLACIKATEMSRRLDKLTIDNPVAAVRLSRNCAEVIALSRLLEEEVRVGTLSELSVQSDKLAALFSATEGDWAGGLKSNSAKQFLRESVQIARDHSKQRVHSLAALLLDKDKPKKDGDAKKKKKDKGKKGDGQGEENGGSTVWSEDMFNSIDRSAKLKGDELADVASRLLKRHPTDDPSVSKWATFQTLRSAPLNIVTGTGPGAYDLSSEVYQNRSNDTGTPRSRFEPSRSTLLPARHLPLSPTPVAPSVSVLTAVQSGAVRVSDRVSNLIYSEIEDEIPVFKGYV